MKAFAINNGVCEWVRKSSPSPTEYDVVLKPIHLSVSAYDIKASGDEVGTEVIGEIVELGEAVKSFCVGDRVIVPCDCVCGAFAEYFMVRDAEGSLVKIPDNIKSEDMISLCRAYPKGFLIAEDSLLSFGDNVAVFSNEAEGLSTASASFYKGAGELFLISSRNAILDSAVKFGVSNVVNYIESNIQSAMLGKTVDKAIIVDGDSTTLKEAISIVREGGEIIVATPEITVGSDIITENSKIKIREIEVRVDKDAVQRTLRLVTSKRIFPGSIITNVLRSLDSLEYAIELAKTKPRGYIKVVVNV